MQRLPLSSFGTRRFCGNIGPLARVAQGAKLRSPNFRSFSPTFTQYRYQSDAPESQDIVKDLVANESVDFQSMSADMKEELLAQGKEFIVDSQTDFSSKIHAFARMLIEFHDIYQVPWWAVILGSSVAVRLLLSPLVIGSAKTSALIASEQNTVDSIRQSFMQDHKKPTAKQSSEMRAKINDYYASKGISPMRNLFTMFLMFPAQIYVFIETRLIAYSEYPGMHSEGLLWFQDLTVPDPLYLLPMLFFICSTSNYALGHLFAKRLGVAVAPPTKFIHIFLTGLMVIFSSVMSFFPAALQWLMLSNVATILSFTLMYRIRAVRRLLNLPPNIGVPVSVRHSDPKQLKKAFGPNFGKSTPPDLNRKPSLFTRIFAYFRRT